MNSLARSCVHAEHPAFDIAGAVVRPDHGKLDAAKSGDAGLILVARRRLVDRYLVHRAAPRNQMPQARRAFPSGWPRTRIRLNRISPNAAMSRENMSHGKTATVESDARHEAAPDDDAATAGTSGANTALRAFCPGHDKNAMRPLRDAPMRVTRCHSRESAAT
jgi:hypothetical protein